MTQPKPGRYLRFSLMSLLLLVSAVGLFLAPVVNRVRHQSRTIEAVERIGGKVNYQWEPDATSKRFGWLRPWLDDDYFRTVQSIYLQDRPATDELVNEISRLNGIVQLNFCKSRITDKSLLYVGRMRQLKALDVGFNKITNEGLVHLAPLDELVHLDLDVTEVTDDGLPALRELPKLYRLQLYHTAITNTGAAQLGDMPWLGELDLGNTLITNDGLVHLQKLPNLTFLRLEQGTYYPGEKPHVSDEGLEHIANMPKLTELMVSTLGVTDEGIARLQSMRPALKISR